MNKKYLIYLLLITGNVFCFSQNQIKLTIRLESKTNLLVILTDQHSYDMLSSMGNSQVKTPNIDSLAKNGVLFKNSVSNYPVCTPMRGMLLTGMHPFYNGTWKNDVPLLPKKIITFAEVLKEQNYNTGYIGKWHLFGGGERDLPILPGENRHGFETLLTDNVTVDFSAERSFYWNDAGDKIFFKDVYEDNPWELEAQTRQAEGWLNDKAKNKNPFALFVSWHPPHDFIGDGCTNVPGRQHNYNVKELDGTLIDPYAYMEIVLRPDLRNIKDEELIKCRKEQYRNYMAMVTACDNMVGRLVKKLKEEGVYENTLIVFTSDHGDMLGSHNTHMPKRAPHDYSVRVPLILSGKNIKQKNTESELLIGTIDLMPTILGIINIPIKDARHGLNLSDAIQKGDEDTVEYQPIFTLTGHNWRGVYTKDWTYSSSMYTKDGLDQNLETNVLFDHKKDAGQLVNLYKDENYKEVKQSLKEMVNQWVQEYNIKDYTSKDLLKVNNLEWYQKNYTKRPIDILNKNR
jgi:arylsulfatase A-like enzyme